MNSLRLPLAAVAATGLVAASLARVHRDVVVGRLDRLPVVLGQGIQAGLYNALDGAGNIARV